MDSNGATMNSNPPFSENYVSNGFAQLLSVNFDGNSNECEDNNDEVSAFGGCASAVETLGCSFNFSGTLIEDICPVSCDNCEDSNDEIAGCQDITACNYDGTATEDDGSCIYAEEYYDCNGNCLNDTDDDGICDEIEVIGCTDPEACNYDQTATDDDNLCFYPEETYLNCNGECLNDSNSDGICDEIENNTNCQNEYDPSPCDEINISSGELFYNPDVDADGNFTAYINNFFQSSTQLFVPIDTVIEYDLGLGPQIFDPVYINSISVQEIQGLPDGLDYECSTGDCSYDGGTFGCFSITSSCIKYTPADIADASQFIVYIPDICS